MVTITQIVAGPALDATVAEKVFGACRFVGDGARETRDGTNAHFCLKCGQPFGSHDGKRYSTDIAAAWLIVEKLGLSLVRADAEEVPGGGWFAAPAVADLDGWEPYLRDWARAASAPMAICLAALTTKS